MLLMHCCHHVSAPAKHTAPAAPAAPTAPAPAGGNDGCSSFLCVLNSNHVCGLLLGSQDAASFNKESTGVKHHHMLAQGVLYMELTVI